MTVPECLSLTFGGFLNTGKDSDLPAKFCSLREACICLDWIISTTQSLSSHVERIITGPQFPSSLRTSRGRLLSSLRKWRSNLEFSPLVTTKTGNIRESLAVTVLCLYHNMVVIMAETCLRDINEMIFDAHLPSFVSILTQTRELWTKANAELMEQPSQMTFIVDLGFILPLYYTALKCREPKIRRSSIALLQRAPHIKGSWDGRLAGYVAKRIMEMEEDGTYADYLYDATDLSMDPWSNDGSIKYSLPFTVPNASRIYNIHVISVSSQKRAMLIAKKYVQDGLKDLWHYENIE